MKILLYTLLIYISLFTSCEDDKIIINCKTPTDCKDNKECRFDNLDSNTGICVIRERCIDNRCKSSRVCNDNYCGTLLEPSIEEFSLNIERDKDFYYQIKAKNLQGSYYYQIVLGELPSGITLSSSGEIKGVTENSTKSYNIIIELINSSKDSYYIYNYKRVEIEIKVNILEKDLCKDIVCSDNEICNDTTGICELVLEDGMSRIHFKDNTYIDGEILYIWNHNIWWWDAEDSYTYAIFTPKKYEVDKFDNSIQLFSSEEIELIKNNPKQFNLEKYYNFLKEKNIFFQSPLEGISYIITSHDKYHLEESGYGDFAWDFIKLDEQNNSFINNGSENSDYFVWNEPVYLPIGGYLFEVKDNIPDNTPGEYEDRSNSNMIGIEIKGNYYLYLLHFKKRSIPIAENNNCEQFEGDIKCLRYGEYLEAGTYLGRVGNSGVSMEPHLHFTLFWFNQSSNNRRMWSIPSIFKNVYSSETNSGSTLLDFYTPKSGNFISNLPF